MWASNAVAESYWIDDIEGTIPADLEVRKLSTSCPAPRRCAGRRIMRASCPSLAPHIVPSSDQEQDALNRQQVQLVITCAVAPCWLPCRMHDASCCRRRRSILAAIKLHKMRSPMNRFSL